MPESALGLPILVCADDFGLAPGVSDAIVELLAAGRLSATSAMSACADWPRAAPALRAVGAVRPIDVGLHLTLTDQPALTAARGLACEGRLPALSWLLPRALARRLPAAALDAEVAAQFDAFESVWGGAPAHVDGHQHVHLLPQVRECVLAHLMRRYRPGSVWVRDCVESPQRVLARRMASGKALFIAGLGLGWRRMTEAAGVPANRGFAGLHDFSAEPPFGQKMRHFLTGAGPRPLLHVHPGRVDAALRACDVLTVPREWEYRYLAGNDWLAELARAGRYPAPYAAFVAAGAAAAG